MYRRILLATAILALVVLSGAYAKPVHAAGVSGAIWTTLFDGSDVNGNIYTDKNDVYLNGGPGRGAGTNAPGLSPDGFYVFMVTDPSGKTLLSTDKAQCRIVVVSGGIMTGAAPAGGCEHKNGSALAGTPVQLMPYNNTPNSGGEYKVWLTPLISYLCPLSAVSCDAGTWGFDSSSSKRDNFKVKIPEFQEIDTQFQDAAGVPLDGYRIQWIDTFGNANTKWSYVNEFIPHLAHVEAVEVGQHAIVIEDQPGCTVGSVLVNTTLLKTFGAQTVPIRITQAMKNKGNFTVFIRVYCQ